MPVRACCDWFVTWGSWVLVPLMIVASAARARAVSATNRLSTASMYSSDLRQARFSAAKSELYSDPADGDQIRIGLATLRRVNGHWYQVTDGRLADAPERLF